MTTEDLSQTLSKLHEELSARPELDADTIRSLKLLLERFKRPSKAKEMKNRQRLQPRDFDVGG